MSSEVKKQINELTEQIRQLNCKLYDLYKEDQQTYIDKSKLLIGKCFLSKSGNHAYCICGELKRTFQVDGSSYLNHYQIPVISVLINHLEADLPEYDSMFSRCLDADSPLEVICKEYKQITYDEFEKYLNSNMERILGKIAVDEIIDDEE